MWELDCEEGWAPRNWCFWSVVLEKTLESPLDCKEMQPVHSEGDQPWDFFGRNDAKAETPVLWPPHVKSWQIGKDSDAGRDWGQEEKGMTESEMAGWHRWLDGRESEWTPGVGDRQGGLACCDSWGRKELDTTERLIWCFILYAIYTTHATYTTCFIKISNPLLISDCDSTHSMCSRPFLMSVEAQNTLLRQSRQFIVDFPRAPSSASQIIVCLLYSYFVLY